MKIAIIADDGKTILGERVLDSAELKAVKGVTANPKEQFLNMVDVWINKKVNQFVGQGTMKAIVDGVISPAFNGDNQPILTDQDKIAIINNMTIPDLTQPQGE